MDYIKEYERWLFEKSLSDAEREELISIKENREEIEDRFFAPLKFGTAGLRGVIGLGTNRMNVYTVRQATQGIAALIRAKGNKAMNRGVAICMDCRTGSEEFAREAACVLAANGVSVYLFESMRPTPELSFAIRAMDCIAGINITASHNPKEYNGYKAYWSDGAQLPPKEADVVLAEIRKTDIFSGVRTMDYELAKEKGLITLIGEEVDEAFLVHSLSCSVRAESIKDAARDFKIVYTPFHGTGARLVPELLSRAGFKNIICVPEQMIPDGNFSTVKSPNPENREGFALAIELAKSGNADLIIGTDPDADRIGVLSRDKNGEYVQISGNQLGVLLLDYIITAKKESGELGAGAYAIKTIVTTEMARRVCEENGVSMFETFTGFKFIAEKIEEEGSEGFVFGYEESYGYLVGDFCRDKDAVTASLLVAEMAAYYSLQGKSLYEAMLSLYEKYGAYDERTVNVVLPGVSGLSKMKEIMKNIRDCPPSEIAGVRVSRVRDYLSGETNLGEKLPLSGSNVLYFEMEDGSNFIIRPSGTEPKIKVYVLASGETPDEAAATAGKFTEAAKKIGE
ncbi:MAG: phospho-sugar mutase [Oscillospiraceae bacterium]|nr:phospho-sugar mutase [Oscillospiraceae bacterium]